MEVKPESSGAHKLLGQILESLGQKELAIAQYKESLELDGRQHDLVLRVCELLVDNDTSMDVNRIKYWIERAGENFTNHQIIFQLKEKIVASQSNSCGDDLEALIVSEITSRPLDINLRVKLIKYYTSLNRMEDAYKHAVEVESTEAHRDSISWYEALSEFLSKYKEGRQLKWSFWVLYVSSLERFTALSLKEHGNPTIKTVQEASQAVLNFDQCLTEAKRQNYTNNLKFIDQMFEHMWGQLQYHLACLLLRKTKRDQKNWAECGRLCSALLLGAIYTTPVDPTAPWAMSLKEQCRAQVLLWSKEGSYRCSQAGHVLQDYAHDNARRLLNKIEELCNDRWREHIYRKIFSDNNPAKLIGSSYFAKNNAPNPPLRLLSAGELKIYDKIAKEVWPGSLHHHVWLGIVNKKRQRKNSEESEPYPNEYSRVFVDLQMSVYNLSQAAPDSLGQLDVDAFLNAAVLCAAATVTEQQKSGYLNPDRMPTLPADMTNPLCSSAQEKWWSLAYRIYRRQENSGGDLAELRQDLQRGLEVVRCIGSHGLHPGVLAQLAKIFHYRARKLKAKDNTHQNLSCLEARYELYWSSAVPLLERILNNQTIRTINNKLFDFQGKELSNLELTNALEEGRLILAQKLLRDKLYEQAIDALQPLKCPEASYLQGEIYKKLGDDLLEQSNLNINSSIQTQHIAILNKAKNSYYLTLDRLRSPGTNPNHPLNADLGSRIAAIEDDLKRFSTGNNIDQNKNDYEVLSDTSYSSAHSATDHLPINNLSISQGNTLLTPQRTHRRTPKQSSTPRPQQMSRIQQEARPSPERLDAQIRQIIHSKDNMIQTMMDQQRAQIDLNKQLFESVEILRKEIAELRIESQQKPARVTRPIVAPLPEDDPGYIFEEDYDMNFTMPVQTPTAQATAPQLPRNMFAPTPPRHPYQPPMMYPQQPPLGGFYQGGLPFTDPQTQHLQPFYSPPVYPMPGFFPKAVDPTMGGMQLLHQRLFNQLTDLVSPQQQQQPQQQPQQQQQPPMQIIDMARNDSLVQEPISMAPMQMPIVKDTALIKTPPVNVVITSSDTLPTNVPTVQPTLSVTVPAHHRNVGNSCSNINNDFPHNYQISMPSHANIPTTVNLPPLSATMTTTIAATVSQQERNNAKNNSIMSTGSHNSSIETVEVEHDPIPNFLPVIPLPAEVIVTTGEEDEETLFCSRAKLFRFADKEWKERGVGNVKLLRNNEGKTRLLMRRDQVLKICANHTLTPDLNLKQMPNNDKAWIWAVNDFADEQWRLEKFCIRFKLLEEATLFKECFDKAKDAIVKTTVKPKEPEKIEKIVKIQEKTTTSVPLTENKTVLGGFSFTSPPIIQQCTTIDDAGAKKTDESVKPSPFSGFSFTKNDSSPFSKSVPAAVPLSEMFKPAAGSWECTSCYTRNNASANKCIACSSVGNTTVSASPVLATPTVTNSQPPLSALFKPASDSWECQICYIRNSKSNSYCVACDSPSDPSLPPKPKSGGFGVKPSVPGATTTFTFGIPTNNPPKGFTLGIDMPPAPPAPVPSTFSFGSPGKSFDFQFSSKSPVKSPAGIANVSEDEVVESEDVYFAPIIPLPDKVDVKTGEEDEEILYAHRAKLYRYDTTTKEWKERGLGDIKLLQHQSSKKLRLVMRRDQTLKLCLNHIVNPDLEITSKDDKTWLWNAADYSDGEIEYVQLACRFKNSEIAGDFKTSVESAINNISSMTNDDKTKKIVQSTSDESVNDLQVVYATTVTQEEKDAALKLKLPANFYAYKQKKDCKGCIGCIEPDVPLFDDKSTITKKPETPKTPVTVAIAPAKFNSPKTPTTVATTTSLIFGGTNNSSPFNSTVTSTFATPIFGGSGLAKDDKTTDAKASFVFGSTKTQEDSSTTFFDKTICSPADTKSFFNFGSTTQPSFGNQTSFGLSTNAFKDITPGGSVFGALGGNQPSFGSTTNSFKDLTPSGSIFGTPGANQTSIFGGNTNKFSTPIIADNNTGFGNTKDTPSNMSNIFTSSIMNSTILSTTTTTVPVNSPPTFGGGLTFGSTPDFGSKTEATTTTQESPAFLSKSDNITDFSALAAKGAQPTGFKTDPNFTFAGAGTSVFGAKNPTTASTKTTTNDSTKKYDNDNDGEEEDDDNQEYDPHYEPIIPLPDAVEVRTGEEDEEKVFSHRAKLYRYEAETKEWKERGVGDMKLLYHPQHNTYRLLLRREQVHKVVCNFLLTLDIDFQPLKTSDTTWIWSGMNYVDENLVAENLAIKFKNQELAKEFKNAIDRAQEELRERRRVNEEFGNHFEGYQDENEDEDDDGDEDEDDDPHSMMFERPAALICGENGSWKGLGTGQIKMLYDSDIFGARIVFESTTGEILCSTVISIETEMEVMDKKNLFFVDWYADYMSL